MSTTNWYVSTNGSTWITCASAGIVRPRLTLRANGVDELLWQMDGDALATYPYAYGSKIYLAFGVTTGGSTDYTIRFVGTIVSLPRTASGVIESIQYKAQGGWWWLEQITYQQPWQMLDPSTHTLVGKVLPRIVLGQDNYAAPRSMGAEVAAAIAYAISKGAPIASGTIDTLATMPFSEQTNIPVAEVIRQAVRLQPDTVGWFDYSSGTPTFNFRAAGSLSATTIGVLSGAVDQITLTPRYDLQLPGITVNYETSYTYNGQAYTSLATDTAGTTTDPRAPAVIYPLQGVQADIATQAIVVQAYPLSLNDTTFWTSILPWLGGNTTGVTITGAARTGTSGYQNLLVDGTIQSWMNIGSERETISCLVSYTTKDGSGNIREVVTNRAISIPVTSCATGLPISSSTAGVLTTNTYQATLSFVAAEPQPSGLAAALYASWSRLHFDGSFRMVEQECGFTANPATLLNLSGGLSAWASMNALCPEASYDIETGTTSITCGTFGRLQADSLVAFWRGIHHYRYAFHAASKASGSSASGSIITGASNVARLSTCEGDSGQSLRAILRATSSESLLQTIDLNPAGIVHSAPGDRTNRTLSPREVWIPYQSGSTWMAKLCQVLCSDLYDTGVAIGGGAATDPGGSVNTLGSNVLGAEGPSSASDWVAGGSNGLVLWVETRQRYYSAGLQTWWAYARALTFDSTGKLYKVSGTETRFSVTTPASY